MAFPLDRRNGPMPTWRGNRPGTCALVAVMLAVVGGTAYAEDEAFARRFIAQKYRHSYGVTPSDEYVTEHLRLWGWRGPIQGQSIEVLRARRERWSAAVRARLESSQTVQEVSSEVPGITMAMFEKIAIGMTPAQVTEITGSPGRPMSEVEMAGIRTVARQWMNDDGSNMIVTFQGDKVLMKAQAFL